MASKKAIKQKAALKAKKEAHKAAIASGAILSKKAQKKADAAAVAAMEMKPCKLCGAPIPAHKKAFKCKVCPEPEMSEEEKAVKKAAAKKIQFEALAKKASKAGGDDVAFGHLAEMVIAKSKGKCTKCGAKATGVHHKDTTTKGWKKHLSLVAICKKCHKAAHQ